MEGIQREREREREREGGRRREGERGREGERERGREGGNRFLIIRHCTRSTDDVILPSQRLKTKKVIIYGVGVGRYFNINQLEQMASRPLEGNLFTGQFNKLHHIRDDLVRSVCLGKNL